MSARSIADDRQPREGGALVPLTVGRDYLACKAAKRSGSCGSTGSVKRASVEEPILDGLKAGLMTPALVEEFADAFAAETKRLHSNVEASVVALEREQVQVGRKLEGLIDALAEGMRSATIKERIAQLERRQSELEHELSGRRAAPPRLPTDLGSLYRSKVESLHQLLLEPAGRTEAIEVLQGLIDRVEVRPTGRGKFEFELVGDLASMVELGLDSKTSAPGGTGVLGGYRSSGLLVAGTGFEPVTFRL